MRALSFVFGAASLVAFLPPANAEKTAPNPSEVEKWITDLDSTNFNTRERASKKLLALKEGALAPLKVALQDSARSIEYRRRVENLLIELKVFERDGEPVNGLRLFLHASNDTLKIGDQMTFLTALCNVSKEDLVIQIGWQFPGSDFTQGGDLHSFSDRLQAPESPKHETKRPPYTLTLPAGKSTAFVTPVSLQSNTRQKNTLDLEIGFGEGFLDVPANGPIRLRMIHTVEVHDAILRRFSSDRDFGRLRRPTKLWSGTVRSNDIFVKLVPELK